MCLCVSTTKQVAFSVNTPVLEGALSLNSLLPPGGQLLPPERASTLWLLFLKKVRLASHLSPGCWNFCSVARNHFVKDVLCIQCFVVFVVKEWSL